MQKTSEATGALIGKNIVDKIASSGKTKIKWKVNERQEIYVPPKKWQQVIDELRLFWHHTTY